MAKERGLIAELLIEGIPDALCSMRDSAISFIKALPETWPWLLFLYFLAKDIHETRKAAEDAAAAAHEAVATAHHALAEIKEMREPRPAWERPRCPDEWER